MLFDNSHLRSPRLTRHFNVAPIDFDVVLYGAIGMVGQEQFWT
jgi:hypothetical protein